VTTEVLFLHGFAGAPSMWDPIVAGLTEVSVVVHRPWLPGHGPTPTAMTGGFEEAVDRLYTSFAAERRVVIGYSLGGRLAVAMAASHADVRALVVGGHVGLDDQAERASRRRWERKQARAIERRGVAAFMEEWATLPIFATQKRLPSAVRDAQAAWRRQHTPRGLAWAMEALGLGNMPAYGERARGRFVTGALDRKFTELMARVGAADPDVSHRIVPDVGHNVVLEAPAVIAEEVRALVRDPG
jgi:2-succinyl-6-hydroxy-2,4-cyclohexadiene-1-carboxylate synthase